MSYVPDRAVVLVGFFFDLLNIVPEIMLSPPAARVSISLAFVRPHRGPARRLVSSLVPGSLLDAVGNSHPERIGPSCPMRLPVENSQRAREPSP